MNSHEYITRVLHDFTCMLLSVAAEDVESTVQYVETRGNPVNLTAVSYIEEFSIETLI